MSAPSRWLSLAVVAAMVTAATTPAAQSNQAVTRFSALAVSMGAPPGQTTLPVDLTITRWSSPEERQKVMVTLLEQGPKRLLEVLQAMPSVGRLTTPGVTGHQLRYAEESRSGGTSRILLITDRPVGAWEVVGGERTLDYPFTVIQLRVGPSGQGEGQIAVAAKVTVDKRTKTMAFEDYSISPVLLQRLRRER